MNKILIIISIFCFPIQNLACSCIGKRSVKEEVKESDIIVLGKVISKVVFTIIDENLPPGLVLKKVEYQIVVANYYKGFLSNDTIKLVTGIGNGDCGYEFMVGCEYIIYTKYSNQYFANGKKVDNFLYTDICTRSQLTSRKEIRKIKRYTRVYNE